MRELWGDEESELRQNIFVSFVRQELFEHNYDQNSSGLFIIQETENEDRSESKEVNNYEMLIRDD